MGLLRKWLMVGSCSVFPVILIIRQNIIKAKKMNFRYVTSAIILFIAILTGVYTTKKNKSCVCKLEPKEIDSDYVIEVPENSCELRYPSTQKLVDNKLISKNNLIIYTCKDKLVVLEKPKKYIGCKYLDSHTCSAYLGFSKIVNYVISYLLFHFTSGLVLSAASIIYMIISMLLKNKMKTCSICSKNYFLAHNCLRTINYNYKNIYLLLVLILHLFMYRTTASLAHSVVKTDSGSLITISDTIGLIQEFEYNGHQLKIIVESTYVKSKLIESHKLLDIYRPVVKESSSTCESDLSECKLDSGSDPDYVYAKPRDNFACMFHQMKVCFTCEDKWTEIGVVYDVKDGELNIEFNSYVDGLLSNVVYVDKRNVYNVAEGKVFVDEGDKVYKGNICNFPDNSCYGKNILKKGKLVQLKDVKVRDHSGDSFDLIECGIKEQHYDEVLTRLNDAVVVDNNLIQNVNLGVIRLTINETVLPSKESCFDKAKFDLNINGCYSCTQGYVIELENNCGGCCQVDCSFGDVKKTMIMSKGSKTIYHGYSSASKIYVKCGGIEVSHVLDDSDDSIRTVSHSKHVVEPKSLLGDISLDFDLVAFKKTLINIVGLTVLVLVSYLTYRIFSFRSFLHQNDIYEMLRKQV
ncbi:putative glycoprotein precursor [Chrysanthemum mosaic-associated virus]|uniref:Glycoprotein n=1 Tax=Chrysanthemum mosaic-associated virus TaxID=2746510 RepID=A0AAU9BDG1_9VIRU|nr:putative glycoprotein precursor [Chrysanthemum mosaic-associated virus]BCK60942.1 putative glycoprotein precursor [Chrysanthemum mosaic-associated virus]